MVNYKTAIAESLDILSAHVKCAQAGVPLPDRELTNLRVENDGYSYRYDTPTGSVSHEINGHGGGLGGTIVHRNEHRQLHRDDGPAIENSKGEKLWFKHGQIIGELGKLGDEYYHTINDKTVSADELQQHLKSHGYPHENI